MTKISNAKQRLPYRVLSAMPAHIQFDGDRYHCDVEAIHVGDEIILRQHFTDEKVKSSLRLSPKQIREEFLNVSTETDAISFLCRCGPFREEVLETTMAHIPEWQEFFRHWMWAGSEPDGCKGPQLWMPVEDMDSAEDARIGGVLKWSIFAPPDSKHVEAFVDCESALEVIGATIALDLLEGIRFEACGWCKSLFEITKANGRQYCGPNCAHRAGQKRRRTQAKSRETLTEPNRKKCTSKGNK
jgi:hypothetical protein